MTDDATIYVQNIGAPVFVPGYGLLNQGDADEVPDTEGARELLDANALRERTRPTAGGAEIDVQNIADHNVEDILAWVGEDDERRQQALVAEQARGDDARSSLVKKLDRS